MKRRSSPAPPSSPRRRGSRRDDTPLLDCSLRSPLRGRPSDVLRAARSSRLRGNDGGAGDDGCASCIEGAASAPWVIEMDADTRNKLEFLLSPQAHPGVAAAPELLETHMSWVILAGERVLKLKKPVRTAWLDFSTLAAREFDSREELRLNRRLAPDVYLGLLALCCRDGAYALLPEAEAGAGVVDWLVQMRRLPAARMLDRLIAAGTLAPADIDALARLLVGFYRTAAPSALDADAYVERYAQQWRDDREVLLQPQFALAEAAPLLDAAARALQQLAPELRERRLVDGHGDLRPEHVCLLSPPVVIDALEFNAALRQVDPFDELGYLGLECEIAGAPWIAARLLDAGSAALTPPPAPLQHFYVAARALLRARLCAAHLLEPNPRLPAKWLPLARRYLQCARREVDACFSAATPRGCG